MEVSLFVFGEIVLQYSCLADMRGNLATLFHLRTIVLGKDLSTGLIVMLYIKRLNTVLISHVNMWIKLFGNI
mgnify:FL=1